VTNRSETESFLEVGQGPNWGCIAKEKTVIIHLIQCNTADIRLFGYGLVYWAADLKMSRKTVSLLLDWPNDLWQALR
jgi:hypothetical protein